MKKDTATLNELIEVLQDGTKFYQEAATKVTRPDLRTLFARMATTKAAITNDLRTAVIADGRAPAKGGSFAGSLHKAYAEMRAKLSSNKNYAYVAELEQCEDRILEAFKHAARDSSDQGVRTIAARYVPEVMRDHDHMRMLKHAHAA